MKKILLSVFFFFGLLNSVFAVEYSCAPYVNTDIVNVAPYGRTAVVGSANFSASNTLTGNTNRDYITLGNSYRFRQNGDVTSAKFYFDNASGNAQGVYITVWRKIGASYTLVNKSENIIGSLGSTPGIYTVNFSTPLTGVQEGDFYGYRLEANYPFPSVAGGRYFLVAQLPGGTESGTVYYNQSPTFGVGSGFAWTVDGLNVLSNANSVTMEFTMTNPDIVLIGDSIIAGHPTHYSYVEKLTKSALSTTIGAHLASLTSYITHNVGIGSQTTSQISARFAADVLSLKPKVIVIEGGVNDIAGGVTSGTFAMNVTNMVSAAEADPAVQKVVLLGILPWTNGTNPQNVKVDEWNVILSGIAATYSKATYVSASSSVGQFRAGGSIGNLWDIQPAYNADGVHYNGSGHQKIAQELLATLCENTLPIILFPLSGFVYSNPVITMTGTGIPGQLFTIRNNLTGVVLATGMVNASGERTKILPAVMDGIYTRTVTLTDGSGNVSSGATVTYEISQTIMEITPRTSALIGNSSDSTILYYNQEFGLSMATGNSVVISGVVGVQSGNIFIDPSSTVGVTGFLCNQLTPTQVICSFDVISPNGSGMDGNGDLVIGVIDDQGTISYKSQNYDFNYFTPTVSIFTVETLSPFSVNHPEIVMDGIFDDNWIFDCTLRYRPDNGGPGLTGYFMDHHFFSVTNDIITPFLDPDESIHTVTFFCVDDYFNETRFDVMFPPIVNFNAPTIVSSGTITDAQVIITSPDGNPVDNISIVSSTIPTATLGTCIGSGGDVISPYNSPAVCDLTGISSSGNLIVQGRDSVILAVGQGYQGFTIDNAPSIINITAPTLLSSGSIINTTISITDNFQIFSGSVVVDPSSTVTYSDFVCSQINGTTVTCTISIDNDGTLVLGMYDLGGNYSTGLQSGYVVDTIPPVVSFIDNISAGPTTGEFMSFTGYDDIGLQTGMLAYGFSIDNICNNTDIYNQSGISGLIITETYNGMYVCVRAVDMAGNISYVMSTYPLNIDTTPPVAPICTATPNPAGGNTTVVITCTNIVSGDVVTIPGTTCVPTPGVGGDILCTGTGTVIGNNPTATVIDPVGNPITGTVALVIDTTPPVITLYGLSIITIVSGTPYTELGAEWNDNIDGTGYVVIVTGTVNIDVAGTYTLTYMYTDVAGNSASISRTINVIPATVAGGGGGSSPTKDNCLDGDYSPSYYDGLCGTKPFVSTGIAIGSIVTGLVETGVLPIVAPEVFEGNTSTGNACPYVDYKMESFLGLKKESQKRRFIVCWLYTNKQTMFDKVIPFEYDRIATREEASRMIGNFVKEVLKKDPIRKDTDKICQFTDLDQARSGLVPYIKQSCMYGVFNGTYNHEFLPNEGLNQAHAVATVLRASYGYQDEKLQNPRFTPYFDQIKDKNLEWRGFTIPDTDLMSLSYKGMTRGNLGELMYRVAVDIFHAN